MAGRKPPETAFLLRRVISPQPIGYSEVPKQHGRQRTSTILLRTRVEVKFSLNRTFNTGRGILYRDRHMMLWLR